MCLTAEALALFLNMLNPQIIQTEAGQVTILATERTAVWVQSDDKWCTERPKAELMARAE